MDLTITLSDAGLRLHISFNPDSHLQHLLSFLHFDTCNSRTHTNTAKNVPTNASRASTVPESLSHILSRSRPYPCTHSSPPVSLRLYLPCFKMFPFGADLTTAAKTRNIACTWRVNQSDTGLGLPGLFILLPVSRILPAFQLPPKLAQQLWTTLIYTDGAADSLCFSVSYGPFNLRLFPLALVVGSA